MAVNNPNIVLKAVWTIHFILSSWGMMSGYIAVSTYWYTHLGVLAFGFWAIVDQKSADAVQMFVVCLVVSVLNDMLCIAIYQPRADKNVERNEVPQSIKDEYRWGLGMSITNLLIKPITIFLMYRVYESRAKGSEFSYKMPEGIPGLGKSRGAYADIDTPAQHPSTPAYQEPPSSAQSAYQRPPISSYHDNTPPTQQVDTQDQSEA